jgi:hypothetical protein
MDQDPELRDWATRQGPASESRDIKAHRYEHPPQYEGQDDAHVQLGHHIKKSIDDWAATAGDHDVDAWTKQMALQRHFKLPEHTLANGKKNLGDRWGEVESQYQEHKPFLHHFIQSVYDDTQEHLKHTPNLLLHRGVGSFSSESAPDWMRPPVKSVDKITPEQRETHNKYTYRAHEKWGPELTHQVHYDQAEDERDARGGVWSKKTTKVTSNPASSWTTHSGVAKQFAEKAFDSNTATRLTAKVPRERVWSTAHTGPGCLGEREAIVLGGPAEAEAKHLGPWKEHPTDNPRHFQAMKRKEAHRAPLPNIDDGFDDWLKVPGAETDMYGRSVHPRGLQRRGAQEAEHGVPMAHVDRDSQDPVHDAWKALGQPMRDSPEDLHPERYEPNRGSGVHLKNGETETRKGADENGLPTQWEVTPRPYTELSLDEKRASGNPMTHSDGVMRSNVKVPGSERPLDHVFRVMHEDEFQEAAKRGHFQSDQRMNLADEGTVTSDDATGAFYMVNGPNRIVRMKMHPEDGWKRDTDGYIKTHKRIPFGRADMVSPVIHKDQEPSANSKAMFDRYKVAATTSEYGHIGFVYVATDRTDYGMQHSPDEEGPPLHALNTGYAPSDIYENLHHYRTGADQADAESMSAIRSARGDKELHKRPAVDNAKWRERGMDFEDHPEETDEHLAERQEGRRNGEHHVTVYRAAPKGVKTLNHGDWVSLSHTYARDEGRVTSDKTEDYPVYKARVKAKHVRWPADSINEFGYFGPEAKTEVHYRGGRNAERVAPSPKKEAMRVRLASDEIVVPRNIDTLRDSTCAVCGSVGTMNGDRCTVCGYMATPSAFQSPDTSLAPKVRDELGIGNPEGDDALGAPDSGSEGPPGAEQDLDDMGEGDEPGEEEEGAEGEEGDDEDAPDLICDNCGTTFDSTEQEQDLSEPYLSPAARIEPDVSALGVNDDMDVAREIGQEDNETGATEGVAHNEGDECPVCGIGTLVPNDEPEEPGEGEAPPDEGGFPGEEGEEGPPGEQDEDEDVPPGEEGPPGEEVEDGDGEGFPGEDGEDEDEDVGGEDVPEDEDGEGPPGQEGEDEEGDEEDEEERRDRDGDELDPPGDPDDGEPPDIPLDEHGAPLVDEEDDGDEGGDEDEEEDEDEEGPPGEEDEEEEDGEDEDDKDRDEDDKGDDRPPFLRQRKESSTMAANINGSRPPVPRGNPPRQGAQPARRATASAPNPAALERRRLHQALAATTEALNRQANRLQAQDHMLGQIGRFVRQASTKITELNVRNETLERQMALVANASGLVEPLATIGAAGQNRVAALYRKANPANPAQPVPEPAPEAPVATSQDAVQAEGRDDVTQLGATPVSNVEADAVSSVDIPYGELANEPVGMTRTDVTAPVTGTQEAVPELTVIPVDARIGDVDNPQVAFPFTIGPVGAPSRPYSGPSVGNPPTMAAQRPRGEPGVAVHPQAQAQAQAHYIAAVNLARLRAQVGISADEPFQAGARIAADMSDAQINAEAQGLRAVASRQAGQPQPQVFHPGPAFEPVQATSVPDARPMVPHMASAPGSSVLPADPSFQAGKYGPGPGQNIAATTMFAPRADEFGWDSPV